MSHMKMGRVAAGAAVLSVGLMALAGTARADDNREQELADRVQQLEKQLQDVQKQVRGGYFAGYSSELEGRIAELERASMVGDSGLFPYWKNGVRADSADKQFKFRFGGRILHDYAFWSGDKQTERSIGAPLTSTADFRDARLHMAGTLYGNVDFKAEFNFAGRRANFADVWIGFPGTPLGDVKIGHHIMPFGFERQTSSRYISTMERGLHNALTPGRETGISINNQFCQDGWVRVAAFRDVNQNGDNISLPGLGKWNFAARASGRPWIHEDDENHWLHVGGSVMIDNNDARFAATPQVKSAPLFVDTRRITADNDALRYGLEAAYVNGPFHVQAEHIQASVDVRAGSDPTFGAYTLQAGFFLTGETRPYQRGRLGRITPRSDYGDDEGGSGAWEIVASKSRIDLSDKGIRGGELDTIVLGLNWYLNPNTRIMLNYIKADLNDAAGIADEVDAVSLRFQVDF